MRTSQKIWIGILSLFLLSVLYVTCKPEEPENKGENLFKGKWVPEWVLKSGVENPEDYVMFIFGDKAVEYREFVDDGISCTGTYVYNGLNASMTFKTEKGKFTYGATALDENHFELAHSLDFGGIVTDVVKIYGRLR
ncbi:MAG: hypothetical protein NC324_00375 [Bacteroides sp.]|nr:hypothetical protein [Bacteroides sp.]